MQTLIGLEIHAQLATKTKMFCGCPTVSDDQEPNTSVCPVCLGLPGSLPVPNQAAVQMAMRVGLAIGGTVPAFSKFDRKNYFYPDLPKGYQISQYDKPVVEGGSVLIAAAGQPPKKVRMIRVHLEEDAAKSTHLDQSDFTLVDFNRGGTPLIESVTEPDMQTPQEAKAFVAAYRSILRYLKVSSADMEKGQLRVDANINVLAEDGRKTPITEIKNMNSLRAIERALSYEIKRHTTALEEGSESTLIKETRGWDEGRGETRSQRSKEIAADYRYFPEPDIPPLEPSRATINELARTIPELPDKRLQRFMDEYELAPKIAGQLVADVAVAEYFENVVSELDGWAQANNKKLTKAERIKLIASAVNWILVELTKHLNKAELRMQEVRITPENFAEFVTIVQAGVLNSSAAQVVLADMFINGSDPSTVIKDQNLAQVSDTAVLDEAIAAVIKANPQPVEDVKAGKTQALQFLVGMVMRQTKGKANPGLVLEMLQKKLKS
ncbi:MAG: Asp-tRNA(Asn)/Glu-tRNA(Gln) amidotransferase subunit GatB [bacterium]|nr:Asp-tRNA(Asn)/Glu-tRNA(Gln) amidotransferase subunit GatB [bacterium]